MRVDKMNNEPTEFETRYLSRVASRACDTLLTTRLHHPFEGFCRQRLVRLVDVF